MASGLPLPINVLQVELLVHWLLTLPDGVITVWTLWAPGVVVPLPIKEPHDVLLTHVVVLPPEGGNTVWTLCAPASLLPTGLFTSGCAFTTDGMVTSTNRTAATLLSRLMSNLCLRFERLCKAR
jgi:hypothetical protein